MTANLFKDGESGALPTNVNTSLAGTLVSSLHRLKDVDNMDAGFFVFSDLSVRHEGTYVSRSISRAKETCFTFPKKWDPSF